MPLITVPLEIGFGQSSVNVQDLEHQQPLQLPLLQQPPPPLLQQPQQPPQPPHKRKFAGLPANSNSLPTNIFH